MHNTGQDRPLWSLGEYRETNGEYWYKHEAVNKKWLSGNFLSNSRKICNHFAFVVHQKQFLNVMFEGIYIST